MGCNNSLVTSLQCILNVNYHPAGKIMAAYLWLLIFLLCCCCRPRGDPTGAPPRSRPHPSWSGQRTSSPPPPPSGLSHSASGPRSVGNLGQLNRCLVLCGCVWHRGQFGVGCVSGVILCRYSCRIGDLFVGSCAKSLLV